MPTPANALDITAAGYVKFDGTNSFSGVSTVPIADGGTNATSFTQSNGIVTYDGTRLVNYAGPQLSSGGVYSNSSQPGGGWYVSSAMSNATGDGTVVTVIFNAQTWQQGSNFNTSTGVFTCPSTGTYLITGQVTLAGLGAGHTACEMNIAGSGGTFTRQVYNPYAMSEQTLVTLPICGINQYTASSTIFINIGVFFSTKTVSILNDNFGQYTYLNIVRLF